MTVQGPVTDNSFDGVLLSYVLHHVQDIDLVLSEVRRVVRNGGLIVVYEDIPKDWRDRIHAGLILNSGGHKPMHISPTAGMEGSVQFVRSRDRLRKSSHAGGMFFINWPHALS